MTVSRRLVSGTSERMCRGISRISRESHFTIVISITISYASFFKLLRGLTRTVGFRPCGRIGPLGPLGPMFVSYDFGPRPRGPLPVVYLPV